MSFLSCKNGPSGGSVEYRHVGDLTAGTSLTNVTGKLIYVASGRSGAGAPTITITGSYDSKEDIPYIGTSSFSISGTVIKNANNITISQNTGAAIVMAFD